MSEPSIDGHSHGQPSQVIGPALRAWEPPAQPTARALSGRTVSLVPADPAEHGTELHQAFVHAPPSLWTYLPWAPPKDPQIWNDILHELEQRDDWLVHVLTVDERPVGMASYLRINAPSGSIEIGGIAFSPVLQQTTAATEAIFLLIDRAFSMGFRRVEWKCDDLNDPSRRAARRFGFTYEGTFRKATHYKGRSRDTAWFAIVDDDWPEIRARFMRWLEPSNFDVAGRQRRTLAQV